MGYLSRMHGLVLLCIHQQTTFEVPSLTDSKDMIDGKLSITGHVTLTTPIMGYFVIQRLKRDIYDDGMYSASIALRG